MGYSGTRLDYLADHIFVGTALPALGWSSHDHRFRPDRPLRRPARQPHRHGPDDPQPSGEGGTATDLTAEYYAQRASAGLIITEGIQPSAVGQGYAWTPGLHSDEQIASWRKVTDAVHAKGGTIYAQIMHAGRISHPVLLPEGQSPVAPSPVAPAGQGFTHEGMKDFTTPRALTGDEIRATVADYATAARNAIEAGLRRRRAARRQRLPHPPVPRAQHQSS